MMKVKSAALVILLITTFFSTSIAQEYEYKNYEWSKNPQIHSITEADAKEPGVIIKDLKAIEFAVDANGDLVKYYTVHKIIRVNADAAIEEYNKVYISLTNMIEILDLKVRSISRSGKVLEMNNSNVKEVENLEDMGPFKILAVEGVEAGGEIEYMYKIKRNATSFFGREFFQDHYSTYEAEFHLISPEELKYEVKGYNGFPTVKDTLIGKKRFIDIKQSNIPLLVDEEYSNYKNSKRRVEFMLAYNYYKSRGRYSSWSEIVKRIFEMTYDQDPANNKAVNKVLSKIVTADMKEDDKIRAIEKYIKNNVDIGVGYSDIPNILKSGKASDAGALKLYQKMFDLAGVKYKLGLGSDRSYLRFDKSFESYDYLENYIFYFDNLKTYMAPTEEQYRYPMVPYNWTFSDALFLKTVELSGYKSALAEIAYIPAADYKLSYDNVDIQVKFDMEADKVKMHLKRSMAGYNSMFVYPYYYLIPEDKKNELIDELLQSSAKDATVENRKSSGSDKDVCPFNKPIVFEGDLTSSELLENVGSKYIFNLGVIIGPQSELYQERKRVLTVENDYNRSYIRDITIEIPEGYTATNLETIKFNVAFVENGDTSCAFISSYRMEGNKIIIHIDEYYKRIDYTLAQFEDFRKVINAAADFNKVKVVLEKK